MKDDILTVSEVANLLRLAKSTVYKLANEGKIPGRKIGGSWRFSRQAILEWLRKQGKGPETPKF